MDLIKIYYSTLDIQPERLLRHFLGSIGFYVEEITDMVCSNKNLSIADIYIISDEYASAFSEQLKETELDENKSILIFMDGWDADGLDATAYTYYYDNKGDCGGADEKEFLEYIVWVLDEIMLYCGIPGSSLVRCGQEWLHMITGVVDAYTENNISKLVQYTRYFYRQPDLYQKSFQNYLKYISNLEKLLVDFEYAPLLYYIVVYAKYELDYICRQNLYECYYDPEELSMICNFLLMRYEQNEELWFLRADIHYDLQGKWQQACTEYQDMRVSHCAYGDYKCGRIVREYLKEYEKAITVLKRAIAMKPDYYAAWYQSAAAYEALGKYHKAIDYCIYIIQMLYVKFKRHLLSPLELEYFYKTVMKIVIISQYNLGDKATADQYAMLAEDVKAEVNDNTYLEHIWPEILENDHLVQSIRKEMRKHLNGPKEKLGWSDVKKIRRELKDAAKKTNRYKYSQSGEM